MASREFPIVGDSLVLGYRFQRYWDDAMARAFFCGELGAGLFLVGALYGSLICMIVGVGITAILKTYFHLSHMGVPARSWRAMLRPDRSWISRGAISIVLFTGAAVLHILLNGFGLAETLGAVAYQRNCSLVKIVPLLALFVMMYHGFAISDSTSISFWNTGLMPISSLAYSALGGMVLSLNCPPALSATLAPPAASICWWRLRHPVLPCCKARRGSPAPEVAFLTGKDIRPVVFRRCAGVGLSAFAARLAGIACHQLPDRSRGAVRLLCISGAGIQSRLIRPDHQLCAGILKSGGPG
jgi:hypothetical protein